MNHWQITKDYINTDKDNREGVERTWNYTQSKDDFKARKDVKQYKWRCYDDDNNLYYEGILWITDRAYGTECMFNPLDEFAEPDAGATSIEYFNETKKVWEVL